MKKVNKLAVGFMAMALAAPMFTVGVNAATTNVGTATVSYNNTNEVPDPDNPDNPQWAVTIPSSIVFTDTTKKVDTSVELVAKNGGAIPTNKNIAVTVASANGYTLKIGADDAVKYALQYGSTIMTPTVKTVGTLDSTTTKITGEAVLNGVAKETGNHTDTLTYTIDVTTK